MPDALPVVRVRLTIDGAQHVRPRVLAGGSVLVALEAFDAASAPVAIGGVLFRLRDPAGNWLELAGTLASTGRAHARITPAFAGEWTAYAVSGAPAQELTKTVFEVEASGIAAAPVPDPMLPTGGLAALLTEDGRALVMA
jgi:hypothetical protein